MALPLEKLGTTYDERVEVVSPRRAYAIEATSNGDLVAANGWAEVED